MSYVTNSGVGRGLLYLGEYGNIPFDLRLNQDTSSKLYRAVSTNFSEAADRAKQAQKEADEKSENTDNKSDYPIPERPWDIPQNSEDGGAA